MTLRAGQFFASSAGQLRSQVPTPRKLLLSAFRPASTRTESPMGFDVSSHPVDQQLIRARLLPYLQGQGSIDDLVAEGVRLTRVRFRANAWALGLLATVAPEVKKSKSRRPNFALPGFEPDLHIWGRPFFITVSGPEVPGVLDRYLRAEPAEVDTLAREQLDVLSPELCEVVTPDASGFLPDGASIAAGLRQELDFLRNAYRHLATGRPVRLPEGETADPEDLFLFHMPLAVVTFAAQFRPGWMARGYVWPTALIENAGLDAEGLIEPAGFLFEPLLQAIGGWTEAFETTIAHHHTLGGAVRPANVPGFRAWWQAHREPLLAPFGEADAATGACAYQKVLEAVRDAERRGEAFLEAAEVYSGFMGIMN